MLIKLLFFNESPDSLIFTFQDKDSKRFRAEISTDNQKVYSRWYDLALSHVNLQREPKDVYLKDPDIKLGTVELIPDQELQIKILGRDRSFSEPTVFKLKPVEQKKDWNEKD